MTDENILILASASPRRRDLLTEAGILFKAVPADVEELEDGDAHGPQIAFINAIAKAEALADAFPDNIVLGADTLIEFENSIIGKPEDEKDAARILSMLSGKTHCVITAVALICRNRKIFSVFSETSEISFKKLSAETIQEYLRRVNTLDKAGAYAIQEYGDLIIERISGPLDNVIGLPCGKLKEALYAFNFGSLTTKRAP